MGSVRLIKVDEPTEAGWHIFSGIRTTTNRRIVSEFRCYEIRKVWDGKPASLHADNKLHAIVFAKLGSNWIPMGMLDGEWWRMEYESELPAEGANDVSQRSREAQAGG